MSRLTVYCYYNLTLPPQPFLRPFFRNHLGELVPSGPISDPPPSIPSFLRQMPFLPQASQFILAWDRHTNMLDCIPGGVAILTSL